MLCFASCLCKASPTFTQSVSLTGEQISAGWCYTSAFDVLCWLFVDITKNRQDTHEHTKTSHPLDYCRKSLALNNDQCI